MQLWRRSASGAPCDLQQLGLAWEWHDGLEKEEVELGLGQRIGALELNRVLSGEHKERDGEAARLVTDGDRAFLHGFEQRALSLRCRAVHLVGEDEAGEDGAGLVFELSAP